MPTEFIFLCVGKGQVQKALTLVTCSIQAQPSQYYVLLDDIECPHERFRLLQRVAGTAGTTLVRSGVLASLLCWVYLAE